MSKLLPLFLGTLLWGVPREAWGDTRPVQFPAHRIANVPFFPNDDYQCGPAALASLLKFWGAETPLETLRKEIYLDRIKGTLPMDLVQAARKRGLDAQMISGSLQQVQEDVLRDHPVIAFLNLGFRSLPKGHFVVVTGIDDARKGLYVHSGKKRDEFISYKRFLKNWDKTERTAILITGKKPPDAAP